MNILEYDKVKMKEDLDELHNITRELKDDINYLFTTNKGMAVLEECESVKRDNLDTKYKQLRGLYTELDYIISCIEKSRDRYEKCEDKVADLLDRIRLEII